jgi:hypothetical protein
MIRTYIDYRKSTESAIKLIWRSDQGSDKCFRLEYRYCWLLWRGTRTCKIWYLTVYIFFQYNVGFRYFSDNVLQKWQMSDRMTAYEEVTDEWQSDCIWRRPYTLKFCEKEMMSLSYCLCSFRNKIALTYGGWRLAFYK